MSADTLLPPRRLSISTFARVVLTLTIFATTSRADLILNLTGSVGSNVINYEASGSVTVTRAVTSTISGLGLAPLAPSAGTTAAWISTFDNDLGDILNDAMNTSLNDDLALSNGGVSYRRNGVQFGILDLIDFDGSATLGGDDVELDTLGSVNYPALVAGDIVSWTGSGTFTLEDGETWETLFNTATTSVQSFSNPIDGGNYTVNIQTIQTILPAPTCEPLDFIGDNVDVNFTFSNNLVAETGTPPFPRNRNVNATGAADVSVQIGIPGTENNGNAGLTLDLDIQQERIRVQGFGSAGATATWTYTITNLDAPSFPGGLPVAFVASGTGNYTLDSATTNSITISGDQDSGHIIVHFLTDTFVDAAADYTITNDVAPVGIVPSAGDTVTWNGTNGGPVAGLIFGTNAFTTVQAAVNAAEEGCTVHIADGTYQQGAEIFVTKSLTLQGDGSISTTLDGNNAYRVIDLPNSPIDVILDGLTVTHGDPGNAPGGGIRNQGATLTISNSTISGNSATAGGGIRNQGILTISNSTISENLGFSGGGGVNNSGTLTATQCTFSGNNGGAPVGAGGGILSNGTFFLSQCTVMGNFAAAGGGINRSGGSATIYNSIIAGNTAASSGPDVIGTFTSNGKNFIGDKSDSTGFAADLTFSTGQTIADLLDVNLADNGGPTLTHALLPGSPAIDAGNNADIPADALDLDGDFDTTEAAPFDQRGGGFPRLLDGDSNGSSLVDIGAIEFLCDTYVDQAGDYTITNDVAPAGISSGDTVTWNGTSGGPVPNLIFGTSAFDSVQAAVDAAGDGCTVHIADGTYQEGAQIDVAKSLTLQGDGDISTTLDGNNAYRVIDLPNSPIDVVLDGLTITRGRPAAGSGGGIRNRGATLKISNATISDSGGGIYNQNSGTVSISNTTISDNTGIQGGGILNTNNGTVTIFNSTISGNSATGGFGGGGIYNENNGVVSVFNSTISGNSTLISAINGGGGILTAAGGGLTLAHCTITGNSTPVSGGGIRRLAGPATIHNCIIAGNTASFSGPDVFGTFTSSGSNFIGDPSGSGSFGSDLTFGTTSTTIADLLDVNLADNGGPTLTHSLISGSPAIDTGNNADIPADALDIDGDMDTTEAAPYDQRGSGFPRLLDGDSNGSSLVDIGAIEFLCDTYVDQAGDYTIDVNHGATPLPTPGDIVTWKPGTPDEVTGLTFGVNAFDSVQDAIDAAGDGCTVFIADGTFQESAEITINKDLTLQGDGSNMTDIDGANSRRVINIGAGGHSITFRDIQVSNGTNSSGNGSGVLLGANSSLTLLGCDVNANKANGLGNGAGVYVDNGASLTAVNTIFRKNNATNSGGGIYNLGGTVDITNATFFDNRATFQTGAAIYNDTATASVTLSSCTLSRNERKPALFNNLGSITLNNTIVAGNGVGLPSLPPSVDVEGAFISNGSNFIGDPTGATGFGSDMTFANTGTVLSDLIGLLISGSSTFYFPLAADSPALEMGNNSDLPADAFDVDGDFDTTEALPTDQRGVGFPRIEGINTDIGAFEGLFNDTILVTTDLDEDNGDPDPNTGNGTSLREAINFANSLPGLQTIEFSTAPGSPFADDFADFVFVDSGQIVISDSIEIIGPGASKLTLDGGNNNRIFRIDGTPPLNVLIEGLRFQGGYANGPGEDGYGGAIYVGGVGTALGIDVDLKDVEFVNNSALKGGGFAFSDAIGTLTVEGCLFEGNYATTEAGGLAFYSGQQFLCSNSTYTNNATDGDAGGLMLTAFTNLRNVTVAGNIADANSDGGGSDIAGGICIGATTTVIANNCLIAGNTRTQDMPFDFDDIQGNNITSPSHNFVSDPGSAGGIMHGTSGNIVGDGSGGIVPPNQVFLTTGFDDFYPEIQDNGGVTGTLSLVQGSPAIDNASPSLLAGLSTDQRGPGFPRIVDGDLDGTALPDMGAFESSVILVTTAVDENDSTIDSSVGAGTSLREAIEEANLAPGISVILFSDTTDGGFTNFHDTSTDTIVLNLGELFIDSNTDIFGPGEEKLTIDGNYDTSTALGDTRLFNLDGFGVNSITVKMQGLTLANARGFGDLNDGGAIYNDGAMLEVKRVRFLKNTAVSDGGAIANFGNLIVEACTFDDNGAGTNGGAIFNRDTFGGGGSPPEEVEGEGEPEIEFEGYYGSSSGFLTFIDSTFSNNSAQNGGAISSRDGTVDGSNSTISNNVAATGGGIHLDDFTFAEFNNLTIAYNTATNSSAGGGIFIDTNDNAEAVLDACIVAGNESQANLTSPPENGQVSAISAPSFLPNDIEGDVDTLDSDGNLVGDAFTSGGLMDGTNFNIIGNSGSGTIDTTTIILSLADNGGPTLTHALAPASPAIDASQLTTAFDTNGQLLANDQRGPGFPRAIDGDNDNSAIVDMGAFELDADTTPPVITLIDNTTIFLECDNFGGYGGGGFIDPGAIALDNVDGDISSSIVVGGDFVDVATLGTYLVTYDVTDSSGNAAAQVTRTVIVEDTTNPLAICWDTTIQLDASGDASISPFDIDAGSTDNCGIFSYAIDTTVFTCADVGPNTVTLTVFDESGNQDSCMATVTVVDDTPPIAICQNITVQLDATGNVTITAAEIDNGSNDACGLASISVSPASFNCSNIGPNNVTLTATDVNGNMSTCTAVVTVEDNLQPVAVCQNITVQLDSSGNATITAFDVDAGSADNCSIASINVSPDSFDCSNLGPNNVTLTVMDGNGNSSNCTATVTVEDDTPPTITLLGDNPLLLDEGDTYTDPGATTNDNCSISGSVIVGGDTVNTAIPGTYVVTYDVMDTSGNAAVQVSRQVIVCPATVYVDQSADFQIDFDATPAGLSIGDMVTWASTVNGPVAGLTFGNDAFTSVQEAIDAVCEGGTVFIAEGLYEEGAQIEIAKDVTIIGDHAETTELSGDNSHRVMEISSGDVTLREISMINGMTTNDGGGIFQISGDLTLEDCLISDNTAVNGGGIRSDGTLTITRSGFIENTAELAGGIFMQGASLCQITDSMISGNEATVFSGGGIFRAIGELTVRNTTITQNSANLVGGGFLSAIGDSAMTFDQCTFDSNSSTNGGGAIFNLGVLTVANSTLHGNTSSRGAGIFNTTNGLRSDGVTAIGGIATVTNSTISGNTATGRGGGIFNEEGAFFPEDPHYSFLYVENSTVFGNSSGNEGGGIFNRSQATIDNSIIAGNTATNNGPDVFDSGVSMTSNNANFIGDPSGAGTAFNADLNFGNTSTTIADVLDVNLSDNGGSTFTHALAVGSPALDSGDNADIPADVLDLNGNMDTTEAVPFDQRGSGFDRLINGLVDIGAYEEQVDVTPPIITLIDNTTIFIECDQFGYEEEEEGGFFDPGATAFDNVDGDISSSIVVGGDEVDIATLGTYFITYDVSDSSGNAAQTVTRAVIVEDTTPPTAICRDTTVQLDASGFASLSPFDIDAGSDDNCGIFDYTIDTTTFTCHDVGPNTVTLTVFDESGNQDSCMATVTVVDDTPPVAICQNITVQLGSSGSVTITGFDVDGGSTDNCSIASINVSPDSFNCTNLGPNNVTLTVIDASGNSSNCTATVTVEDVTDPVITCPADTTVECDADMSPASTGFATAVDNCTANLTITFQDLTTPSTGSNFTITRTWTATDASGNSASCDQMITVQDTMPPVVTCPADIVVDNDPGQCGAVVSFMASATDTCDPAPMTSAVPASGTFFPVGTTQVTVTATDANGNQSQCTFDVTVNDNEDPVVTCPSDITTNIDPGQFGAVVTFSPAGAMDNCPGVNISQTGGLTSGSFFPVGTSSVTYTATDAAGNQSSCSFDVTVNVPYSYSVAGTSQNEGDSGTTDFVFTITRTLDSGFSGNTSIPFSIFQSGPTPFDEGDVSGSASGGGTLEFTGTETTKMVTILVNGDEEFEADEDLEFRVGDFDASTGTLDEFLRTSTTVQILNDDDLTVSISSNMNIAIEPDSPTTIDGLMSFGPQFTITRNGTFGDQDVTIELDGTSTASYPADFNLVAGYNVSIPLSGHPVSGTVTIPDGESQVDIYIDAIDDFAAEVEESVDLTILGEESYSIGSGSGSSAIAQNDYGVTNLNDFNLITNPTTGGEGTLRRAIDNAKAGLMEGLILDSSPEEGGEEEGDGIVASSMFYTSFTVPVVVFEPGLTGEITLMYGPLYIDTNDMDIQGPGADIICVSGDANENDISDIGDSRVFVVSDMYNSLVIDIFSLAIKEGYYPMGNGGAIYNNENLLLDNCVVSDSMANNGGGIRNDYLLFVNDCTFMNNMATIYGGGIDNADQLSVTNSTIKGNSASFGGGIEDIGFCTVENSILKDNSATQSGGGFDCFGATSTIINSTISGNTAGFGAGAFNEQGTLACIQCTIAENTANSFVGGILSSSNAPLPETTIHNTIVAGNTEDQSIPGSDFPSDLATANPSYVNVDPMSSNNLIGDAATAGGLSNMINGNIVGNGGTGVLPLMNIVLPLGDFGGSTEVYPLAQSSPAINAGNNLLALGANAFPLENDQRGDTFPRIVGGTVDIGAYERNIGGLRILAFEKLLGGTATIEWLSEPGVEYEVLRSTDLSMWTVISGTVTATAGRTSYTDLTPPTPKAYYIVRRKVTMVP